jgi:hypothetical protein
VTFERTNVPGLLYDRSTNVVVNTDESELRAYRSQVVSARQVDSLQRQVEDLRRLVYELATKQGGR